MIPSPRVKSAVSRLIATIAVACCAYPAVAQQTNPFPTATPERLKKTASAYRARAELVPDEVRPTYLGWAEYYDSMAALQPGAPVPDSPRTLPGATAPAPDVTEGETVSKPGIGALEAISIAVDVASNPRSFVQGALDAFLAHADEVIAQFDAKFNAWKQAQAELRKRRDEIAAWCAAHADPAAQSYIGAAASGDLDTVKRWIEDGNDPNACGEQGFTALAAASQASVRSLAAQLQASGTQAPATRDSAPGSDEPPLDQAAIDKAVDAALHGDRSATDQLKSICLRPINTAEDGARIGRIMHKLADASLLDNNKLATSIMKELAQALKERTKNTTPNRVPNFPSNVIVTRYLLQHGADLMARTTELTTPLDGADRWSARVLIDARSPVNAGGGQTSALKMAIIRGNTQHVILLISSGADPALDDAVVTDEAQARTYGYPDLAKLLANFKHKEVRVSDALHSITRPGPGAIALNYAACAGNTDLLQKCLDTGARPDAADDCSWTPLMNAAQADNIEVMKMLLDKGAAIDMTNAFGQTALMLAIRSAHIKASSLLLEHGANVQIKDIFNMGAREWLAARMERQNLVKLQVFSAEDARMLAEQLKQAEDGKRALRRQ